MIFYSIILAVYNVENYLKECLESIIFQKYTNWEAILVDDGSSDNSGTICDEFSERDSRFKVFHNDNSGSLMARRYGLNKAKGDYILFVDSDDLINSNLLQCATQIIESTNSDLVIYRFQRFGRLYKSTSPIIFPEGTIVGEGGMSKDAIWKGIITGNEYNNLWNKIIKRDIIDIDKDYSDMAWLKYGTDSIQVLPILDNASKIYFTEKIYYYYRYNDSGISSVKARKKTVEEIQENFITRKILREEKLKYLKKNNIDTAENIKLFYVSLFNSDMELLISQISTCECKDEANKIIEATLMNEDFAATPQYLCVEDFKGKKRKIFELYCKGEKELYEKLYRIARVQRLKNMINQAINTNVRYCKLKHR